jgi:catechol 2,3-dioxygenase-like lactoylglutathione lyase family enzyme
VQANIFSDAQTSARCCCGVRARVIDIAFFGLEEDFPAGARPFRRLALWLEPGFDTIEHMTIQWMEHVGIVVDDLAAATEFFVELGLELQGEGPVEGCWVDRIVGLDGVRAEIAFLQTPDGHGRLELTKFHTPSTQGGNRHAPANTPGIRHVAFAVEDIDAVVAGLRACGAELVGELGRHEDSYRLCYVRGPEGIIIELAEHIG